MKYFQIGTNNNNNNNKKAQNAFLVNENEEWCYIMRLSTRNIPVKTKNLFRLEFIAFLQTFFSLKFQTKKWPNEIYVGDKRF